MIWKPILFSHRRLLCTKWQTGIRNLSISKVLRKNHYDVLGVKRDASQADIKNAYFELSKIYHPDRIAATDENIAKFREISAAYEILGNEQSRKLYDRGLLGEGPTIGIDETENPNDPIIKFYKQRQLRQQVPTPGKPEMEVDAWAKSFYKEARTKVFAKNELFQESKKLKETESRAQQILFMVAVAFVMNVVWFSNYKDHPVQRFFHNLRSIF